MKVTAIGAMAFGVVILVAGATLLAQAKPGTETVPPAKAAAKAKPAATVKAPDAVLAAFKKAYPDAQIKHVSHETEEGVEQYELETIDHGLRLDVNYKPDGTLLVEEREVEAADLPEAVTSAIAARYPKATPTLRERVTEGGKISYEIALKGAPVKSVQLTPEGKWISPKPAK